MKIYKILPLLLLAACSRRENPTTPVVSRWLSPFVQTYEEIFNTQNRTTVVLKKTIYRSDGTPAPYNVVGLCSFLNGSLLIQIKYDAWKDMDVYEKEQLMFHELTHCNHGIMHDNTLLPDGTPASIMYYLVLSSYIYKNNRAHYINELRAKIQEVSK